MNKRQSNKTAMYKEAALLLAMVTADYYEKVYQKRIGIE